MLIYLKSFRLNKEAQYFNIVCVIFLSSILQVMQGLAKSVAWDGEGATCLIEVNFPCCLLLVSQFSGFL